MKNIKLDLTNIKEFVSAEEVSSYKDKVGDCHHMLHEGTGSGSEYLGWVDLPNSYDKEEFARVKATAEEIRGKSDIFIVVGVGGSYLGSRAGIQMLKHTFYNELPYSARKGPRIYYMGYNVSPMYTSELMELIEGADISINVISKSGTTMEPAIAFRFLKEYMEKKYGKAEARKRIYVTTDKENGALKKLSMEEGYETFVVPDDIGGRYSVLTSVGLLPIAVAGIDIDEIMEGAREAEKNCGTADLLKNDCYKYAVIRNILYNKGKVTEMIVNCEPKLCYFGQWFKQLFAESEGKNEKGIFPSSFNFTTDLHSLGQFIQDGRKIIFETALNIESNQKDLIVEKLENSVDGLEYLEGKAIGYINRKSLEGALKAHAEGGVPSLTLNIPEVSPYYFGYLIYFFEKACGMSAYLLGVNPFDQPGVEVYKKNVSKMLGKTE